jgi:hypothetical protein
VNAAGIIFLVCAKGVGVNWHACAQCIAGYTSWLAKTSHKHSLEFMPLVACTQQHIKQCTCAARTFVVLLCCRQPWTHAQPPHALTLHGWLQQAPRGRVAGGNDLLIQKWGHVWHDCNTSVHVVGLTPKQV